MVFALPCLLNTLASGEQDVTAGRDLKWFSLVVKLCVVAVQVALQRPLVEYFVGLSRCELRKVVSIPRGRSGMAAIENDGKMGIVLGNFRQQYG